MSDTPYETITEYCLNQNKDLFVRNFAYGIYTQKLNDAVENYKKEHEGNITEEIEEVLRETSLREQEVKEYVAEAERIIASRDDDLIKPYRGMSRLKEFGWSVLASFLGALFFAILLFVLFVLAEDQIRPLMQRLLTQPTTEQAVSSEVNKGINKIVPQSP